MSTRLGKQQTVDFFPPPTRSTPKGVPPIPIVDPNEARDLGEAIKRHTR